MNFFSKIAMFATLSTVMFSGFAMDSGDFPSLAGWLESAPAVTENVVATVVTPAVQQVIAQAVTEEAAVTVVTPALVAPSYKEQAIQLLGTAKDKAKNGLVYAYAGTKGFLSNSKNSVVNFGFNCKDFAVDSYELAKNDPSRFGANATRALVISGMGALVLYNVYSVAKALKAPAALEANVPATEAQAAAPVVQAEQATAPVVQEVEQAAAPVIELTAPVVVSVVAKPAQVKKNVGSGFAKALARNAELAKNK